MKSQSQKGKVAVNCEFSEFVKVTELRAHPKNRNIHSNEQIDRLAKLILYQGFRHPILVSKRSGYVVAGHGRLAAAVHLGVDSVPVDYQEFADEDAEYAFLISDNAIASWAELDLSAINMDLGDLGPEFDIDLLGIKDFKLDPSDFKEPDTKKDPALKEAMLNSCPNCGVFL